MSTSETFEVDKNTLPPEAIQAFDRGEAVTVMDDGKPIGQLVPDRVERAKAKLRALRSTHPVDDLAELIQAAEPR